jgi:hypothetical protein
MRTLLLPFLALTFTGLATGQTILNDKVIHNMAKTNAASRNGTNAQRVYYMQPEEARRGYGKFNGWIATLQDEDSTTAEQVDFGVSKYVTGKMEPDVTNTGTVFWTRAPSLNFQDPKNPTVKRQAVTWTITLQTPQDTPESFGLFVGLTASKTADGVFIWTQGGATSKLPAALKKDWCYYMDSTQTTVNPHMWGKGTTLALGAFYTEPVLRQFVSSTRYQATAEDLYGLEAYWPDSTAGDKIGWDVASGQFVNGLAVTTLGAALFPKPIVTGLGTFWMNPPFGVIQAPAVFLGTGGTHKTVTPIPAIKGIMLYSQTAFINPQSFKIRMSDLTKIDMQ